MNESNVLIRRIVELNNAGKIALCGYFLSAYDSPKKFYSIMKNLQGIDIIEYGIPSENPFLDGSIIANAHKHVTHGLGVNAEISLSLIGGLTDIKQPRFVMTYARDGRNLHGFIKLCLLNGIHGVFAPDVSIEEARRISLVVSSLNMAYIGFIHDQMNENEIMQTIDLSDMVYLKVSPGTTGQRGEFCDSFIADLEERISRMRDHKRDLIIATGIGIQSADQVEILSKLDINMIIVGTSLMLEMKKGMHSLQNYVTSLNNACIRNFQLENSYMLSYSAN